MDVSTTNWEIIRMRFIAAFIVALVLSCTNFYVFAGPDDRQDRRQERGRSDERQDRRDCRQEEGLVDEDKRECKQEEVRDGVRGNQGERSDDDKADDDD
jgi:hypothetical protein